MRGITRGGRKQEETEPVYPCVSLLVSEWWEISDVLGAIGWTIVLIAVVIVVSTGQLRISDRLRSVVPDRVVQYFNRPVAPQTAGEEEDRPNLIAQAGRALRGVAPPAAPAKDAYFTVGSSKQEVRKAQGAPTESTDTMWRYGESRVYFIGGRVISWSSSFENPLKVR